MHFFNRFDLFDLFLKFQIDKTFIRVDLSSNKIDSLNPIITFVITLILKYMANIEMTLRIFCLYRVFQLKWSRKVNEDEQFILYKISNDKFL